MSESGMTKHSIKSIGKQAVNITGYQALNHKIGF